MFHGNISLRSGSHCLDLPSSAQKGILTQFSVLPSLSQRLLYIARKIPESIATKERQELGDLVFRPVIGIRKLMRTEAPEPFCMSYCFSRLKLSNTNSHIKFYMISKQSSLCIKYPAQNPLLQHPRNRSGFKLIMLETFKDPENSQKSMQITVQLQSYLTSLITGFSPSSC